MVSGISGGRGSLGTDQSYAASRTDPSYASRIANLAVGGSGRNSSGINSADEMFGSVGYGRDSMGYSGGIGGRIPNDPLTYRDYSNPLNSQWNSGNRNFDSSLGIFF